MDSSCTTQSVPESNAPFSQVVIDDRYAHLAGLVAADFPSGEAVLGDAYKETQAVMGAIREMLDELGLGMDRIVRTDVHLANIVHFDEMDRAYREFFEAAATQHELPWNLPTCSAAAWSR